jgi:hypothetical protein
MHDSPDAALAGDNPLDFLRALGGPSVLFFPGIDTTRTRAFVTLLHGNEPSGLIALRRWLMSGQRPAVNTLAVVASVPAALAEPAFFYRMLPRARDLNRCFAPPFEGAQGELARAILELLDRHRPETVVDMHNTSGSGPSFGVVNHFDPRHDALVALFTRRLIVSRLNLGALMELSTPASPYVTLEVGGREDPEAHELAWDGLQRYFLRDKVLHDDADHDWGLEVLQHPIRLELRDGVTLCYSERPQPGYDITLQPDIEHFNFGTVDARNCLGWANGDLPSLFRAQDGEGRCAVSTLLRQRDGGLYPARSLKLFMITNNATIAQTDCLCYAVADDGSPLRSVG